MGCGSWSVWRALDALRAATSGDYCSRTGEGFDGWESTKRSRSSYDWCGIAFLEFEVCAGFGDHGDFHFWHFVISLVGGAELGC